MKIILALVLALSLVGCHDKERPSSSSGGAIGFQPVQPVDPSQPAPTPTLPSIETLSGGFVWKPISEGDGNLVILLPASSEAVTVAVNSEVGDFVGRTNGDRPTYRFDSPGSSYPAPSVLTIGSQQYVVPVPGQRYD